MVRIVKVSWTDRSYGEFYGQASIHRVAIFPFEMNHGCGHHGSPMVFVGQVLQWSMVVEISIGWPWTLLFLSLAFLEGATTMVDTMARPCCLLFLQISCQISPRSWKTPRFGRNPYYTYIKQSKNQKKQKKTKNDKLKQDNQTWVAS